MTTSQAPQYTVSHHSIDVPNLGKITGLKFKETGVVQYLGIPFATIPGRFRKSQLLDKWQDDELDATKLGPYCIQPPRDFYPIPVYERNHLSMPSQDEFELLNLNISLPPNMNPNEKYPVMVFIHGGANAYAGNCGGTYDGHILANKSSKFLEPTINVVINYRLGPFGWLASRDIKAYNEKFGETGVGNYGLWDQHNALKWTNQFIGAFGGDTNKITLFGQSAGSQATHLHILKGDKLFSRAIMQSGLSPLCGIFSLDQYDQVYNKILNNLNIHHNNPTDRVEALLKVDPIALSLANEKVHEVPVVTMAYCDDGDFLDGKIPSWGDLNQKIIPDWIQDVLIGDCINECIIWNKSYKHHNAESLIKYLNEFNPKVADFIINSYNIHPNMSNKEVFDVIELFTTDGMYLVPNYAFIKSNPSVHAYQFNQASHYENPWKGYAHHSLDNTYIWGVLNHTFPKDAQSLSESMTKTWIDFANGKKLWPEFENGEIYKTFGPNNQEDQVYLKDEKIRGRYKLWDQIIANGLLEDFGKVSEDLNLKRTDVHGYV